MQIPDRVEEGWGAGPWGRGGWARTWWSALLGTKGPPSLAAAGSHIHRRPVQPHDPQAPFIESQGSQSHLMSRKHMLPSNLCPPYRCGLCPPPTTASLCPSQRDTHGRPRASGPLPSASAFCLLRSSRLLGADTHSLWDPLTTPRSQPAHSGGAGPASRPCPRLSPSLLQAPAWDTQRCLEVPPHLEISCLWIYSLSPIISSSFIS